MIAFIVIHLVRLLFWFCLWFFLHIAYKTFDTPILTNLCTQLNSIEEGKTTNFIGMIDLYDRTEKGLFWSFLIALLVYHWPSVVLLLKIFPIWLPLMSNFCHWSCSSMCLIQQKSKIDAYLPFLFSLTLLLLYCN